MHVEHYQDAMPRRKNEQNPWNPFDGGISLIIIGPVYTSTKRGVDMLATVFAHRGRRSLRRESFRAGMSMESPLSSANPARHIADQCHAMRGSNTCRSIS
jgi:hypothetical protein